MRQLLTAAAFAVAMMSAGAASAASLFFSFDQDNSSFDVTSNTPLCLGSCSLTSQLLDLPDLTIEEGSQQTFHFGKLKVVGRGLGGDIDAQVSAEIAFELPSVTSVGSSANVAYATAFGVVSGGILSWYDPVHTITTGDGSVFTLTFNNLAGVVFGDQAYANATIRVDSVASPTPEPGTWALLIGGFGLAGAILRRRRTALS